MDKVGGHLIKLKKEIETLSQFYRSDVERNVNRKVKESVSSVSALIRLVTRENNLSRSHCSNCRKLNAACADQIAAVTKEKDKPRADVATQTRPESSDTGVTSMDTTEEGKRKAHAATQTMTANFDIKQTVTRADVLNVDGYTEYAALASQNWEESSIVNTKVVEGNLPCKDHRSNVAIWVDSGDLEKETGTQIEFRKWYPQLDDVEGPVRYFTQRTGTKKLEHEFIYVDRFIGTLEDAAEEETVFQRLGALKDILMTERVTEIDITKPRRAGRIRFQRMVETIFC